VAQLTENALLTDEADFERFFTERCAAADRFSSGDPGPVLAMVPQDGAVTFHSPRGETFTGAGPVAGIFARQSAAFTSGGENELVVLQRGVCGDLGFWTGFQVAVVRSEGGAKREAMRIRVTEVFRRLDGAWKLVHRHADLTTPPA
jgi:ketosteroid isomerase-like protein